MNSLTIALIIPMLNEAAYLKQVGSQWKGLGCDELIIVDGGSDDESIAVLAQLNIDCISSELGRSVQMNAGAMHSTADILLFVHADTEFDVSHIQTIKEVMLDERFVGGRFDVRLSGQHWMFRVIEFMINVRSRLTAISTGDQCQFVRRDVFEKMGGFVEQDLMEDVEFSKQLKRHGKVACLRQKVITSSRRWEKKGILKTVWLMWKLRCLYYLGVSPNKLAKIYRNVR
ncbi:MAG: TIGR04283 family arsenosugar biosynthesis glycosyltransferase [Mariprofundaceae bacterium]